MFSLLSKGRQRAPPSFALGLRYWWGASWRGSRQQECFRSRSSRDYFGETRLLLLVAAVGKSAMRDRGYDEIISPNGALRTTPSPPAAASRTTPGWSYIGSLPTGPRTVRAVLSAPSDEAKAAAMGSPLLVRLYAAAASSRLR